MRIITVAGKRLLIQERRDWQIPSRPVTGPTASPSLVTAEMVHWPGASPNWRPPLDTASWLRWSQDLYLLDKGFSLGYAWAIGVNTIDWDDDPVHTDIWEIRGLDIRPAANNGDFPPYSTFRNPNWNGHTQPIIFLTSVAHPMTDDQCLQGRYMTTWLDDIYDETLDVFPHHKTDATACPGPANTARIGELATRVTVSPPPEPTPPPPPHTEGTTRMMLVAKSTDGGFYATTGLRDGALHIPTEIAVADVFAYGGGFALAMVAATRFAVITEAQWSALPMAATKAQILAKFGAEV